MLNRLDINNHNRNYIYIDNQGQMIQIKRLRLSII